jgi:hypothetical protein
LGYGGGLYFEDKEEAKEWAKRGLTVVAVTLLTWGVAKYGPKAFGRVKRVLRKLNGRKGSPVKPGEWKLGGKKSPTKWTNQMKERGWNPKQIDEAVSRGKTFRADNNVNPGNPATRYLHPETGRSVVIDDVTKEVLHVGGDGFKY